MTCLLTWPASYTLVSILISKERSDTKGENTLYLHRSGNKIEASFSGVTYKQVAPTEKATI